MCRLQARVGVPRTLAEVVLDPEFGLLRQSYAPRRQRHGRVNADGWGVAWWTPDLAEPARWRSSRPLWQDAAQSFGSVARHVSAGCVLASVRSASPGMPLDETATAPFVRGQWALTHNGIVDRTLVPAGARAPDSTCDSAVLAAWLLDAPLELGQRIRQMGTADPTARLNVIATDGTQVLASVWGETLVWRADPEGVTVASEPLDDDGAWVEVGDRHLLHVVPDGVTTTSLEET